MSDIVDNDAFREWVDVNGLVFARLCDNEEYYRYQYPDGSLDHTRLTDVWAEDGSVKATLLTKSESGSGFVDEEVLIDREDGIVRTNS